MTETTETNSLAQALATLMTKLPEIKKSQSADTGSYTYSYADLAQVSRAVLPVLGELGLSFTAKPTMSNGQFVLAYRLLHVSGEDDKGEYPLPSSGSPQSMGSAITYARRYCLCAVTGIAPDDDDDGAAANQDWRTSTSRPAPQRTPQPEPQWETPPPEPVTDVDWANHLFQRITDVSSLGLLRGLYEEMVVKYQAGEVATADQQRFVEVIAQRKKELEGKPE
jgi:hypothetical protein